MSVRHMQVPGAFVLESETHVQRPIGEVFEFFSDARNLDRLTPGWLKFSVITPGPIEMRTGTLIDYKLRIRGLPIRWQSEITLWDPPHGFVDEQRRGPYKKWRHEHRFEPQGSGTRVVDRVTYYVPGGPLINRLFVRRDLEKIFAYRTERLQEIFSSDKGNGAAA